MDDSQFDVYTERVSQHYLASRMHSAFTIAEEMKALAHSERALIPYLTANFYLMNAAQSLYEPEPGRQAAVENIGFLESKEEAYQFDPQLSEDEYAYTVQWMTACSYDNLAKHVAAVSGYNSPDLQDIVEEGFNVCHRTGKTDCISCFREYAVSVYREGGDLVMAVENARRVAAHPPGTQNGDRRFVGARDVVMLLTEAGRLRDAVDAVHDMWTLVDSYHATVEARITSRAATDMLALLWGDPDQVRRFVPENYRELKWENLPSVEENPYLNLVVDQAAAAEAFCAGDFDKAAEILQTWADRLKPRRIHGDRCEVLVRLANVYVAKGDREAAQRIADELYAEASPARSYLYIDRVRRLLDGRVPPTPIGLLESPDEGPYAKSGVVSGTAVGDSAPSTDTPEAATTSPDEEKSPGWYPQCDEFDRVYRSLHEKTIEEAAQTASEMLDQVLAVDWRSFEDPNSVAVTLYFAGAFARLADRLPEAWQLAQEMHATLPEAPALLNIVAFLGSLMRSQAEANDEDPDAIIDKDRLESWFRTSLERKPHGSGHFTRAGLFFLENGALDDAEWCFSRAIAEDRTNVTAALILARIYMQKERGGDALVLLDETIRAGARELELFDLAGYLAYSMDRFTEAATYLKFYFALGGNDPWQRYSYVRSLLALDQPEKAAEVLEELNPEDVGDFAYLTAKAWLASYESKREFRDFAAQVMHIPLYTVERLTRAGVRDCLECLRKVAAKLNDTDLEDVIFHRLIAANLAAPELFEPFRMQRPSQTNLNYYVCAVQQELGNDWKTYPERFADEEDWTAYVTYWGVLARHPEEAEAYVQEMQGRAYDGAPRTFLACELQDTDFADHPGVVWQGRREPAEDRQEE
ncbi:hypothetical protein JCM19992_29740 [Thermostilla marina]